jgi:hypothetical protein
MLIHNRFAIHWSRWHIAILATLLGFYHSGLALLQNILLGKKVARTEIREPPLFILGHWRTGTTLLHELLTLDERHTSPTYCQCFSPHDFLLTERTASLQRWTFPAHRPMDNMVAGPYYPQEEEFAMCLLGQPSPYLRFAFPNREQPDEFLDFEGLSPTALKSWKETFFRFLQQVYYRCPKRLILKSPPNSCRIRLLLELFPDAQFVHIVRDPYVVFPSTLHANKRMYEKHSLQRPNHAGLEEYVLTTFSRMNEKLDEGRRLVDPANFYELRYEDLVHDPEEQLGRLYAHLGLGGFDDLRPLLRQYLADHADYATNTYELTDQQRAVVTERWGDVIRRQGYRTASIGGDRLDDVDSRGANRRR